MQVPAVELITDVQHHVRQAARVGPGRPAIALGLRTAAAIGAPLLAAPWLPNGVGIWAPLAGFAVSLVDKGGAYWSRASAMGLVTVGALLAVATGTIAAGHPAVAIAVSTLGVMACAFAHAWGPARAGIGNAIALHLLVAAFLPVRGSIVDGLLGVGLGAVWAMVLGLVVWPVRVYKPARRGIAAALSALASQAQSLATAKDHAELVRRHRDIRIRLETARDALVATRRGRRGETGTGERLLAIVHACEHVFGIVVGLEELLAARTASNIAPGVARMGIELDRLAEKVLTEQRRRETPPAPDLPLADRVRVEAIGPVDHAQHLLNRLEHETRRISMLIDSLPDDSEPSLDVLGDLATPAEQPSIRERIGAELELGSAVLRHVLRAGICVGIAGTVAGLMHLDHGYWITLTTFVLLQPHRAATTIRAYQRGIGTIAGAVVAALVTWLIPDPRVVTVLIIVLAGAGASIAQLNYGLYSLFVTPTFILLAELHVHDYKLIVIRIEYTLLAGIIAALASALLWPAREDVRLADELGSAIRALARYAEAIRTAALEAAPPGHGGVVAARRGYGLAINNAELALDRVVADRVRPEVVEPGMAMVIAARRLGAALGILGSSRALQAPERQTALAALAGLASTLGLHLQELAGAIEHRKLPPPPPPPPAISDAVLAARWARIEAQVSELAHAAARAALAT